MSRDGVNPPEATITVSSHKRKVRLREMQQRLREQMLTHEEFYETYVRLHRALYGYDPDPADVSRDPDDEEEEACDPSG